MTPERAKAMRVWAERKRRILRWLSQGMSQAAIADKLGVRRQRVHQIINGKRGK